MKTGKSIHTVYEDTPLDQWTLNGKGTQCQDDARESLEEQHADRLKLRAYHLISEVHRLLQQVDADLVHRLISGRHTAVGDLADFQDASADHT